MELAREEALTGRGDGREGKLEGQTCADLMRWEVFVSNDVGHLRLTTCHFKFRANVEARL